MAITVLPTKILEKLKEPILKAIKKRINTLDDLPHRLQHEDENSPLLASYVCMNTIEGLSGRRG